MKTKYAVLELKFDDFFQRYLPYVLAYEDEKLVDYLMGTVDVRRCGNNVVEINSENKRCGKVYKILQLPRKYRNKILFSHRKVCL